MAFNISNRKNKGIKCNIRTRLEIHFAALFLEDALPFSAVLSFNNIIVGASYTSVGDYKLTAQGNNFTISNLSAVDSTGTVTANFFGLVNGQVIAAGSSVPFSLRTTLTGGRTVSLIYSFTVKETGQTFTVKATGKTN